MTAISGFTINFFLPRRSSQACGTRTISIIIDKVTTRMADWGGADKYYFKAKQSAFKIRFVEAR